MTDNNEETAIAKVEPGSLSPVDSAMSVKELTGQVNLIQEAMKTVMKDGDHYGTIPGCGDKKTLFKAGAEKLNLLFKMNPDFSIEVTDLPHSHRDYLVNCRLTNSGGTFIGSGVGSCTTMESKYRYRNAERTCPQCGVAAIIKGKAEYGGGWLCWKKKGGCDAKFNDDDPAITGQNVGKVEHDNPADYYNTCLKMAKKRAMVDAVITRTAASDIFTQDTEDMKDNEVGGQRNASQAQSQPTQRPQTSSQPAQGQNNYNQNSYVHVSSEPEQRLQVMLFGNAEFPPQKESKGKFYDTLPKFPDEVKKMIAKGRNVGFMLDMPGDNQKSSDNRVALLSELSGKGYSTSEEHRKVYMAFYKACGIPKEKFKNFLTSTNMNVGILMAFNEYARMLIPKAPGDPIPFLKPKGAKQTAMPEPERPVENINPTQVPQEQDIELDEDIMLDEDEFL